MKKWIIGGILAFFLLFTFVSVHLITRAVNNIQSVDEEFLQKAKEKTPIQQIVKTERYFGTEPLIIIYGKDPDKRELILFMRENGDIIRYVWQMNAIRKEEIVKRAASDTELKEEIHIIPGIENNVYLWEALYKTKDGSFKYIYYDLYTGEMLRSIKLKKPH